MSEILPSAMQRGAQYLLAVCYLKRKRMIVQMAISCTENLFSELQQLTSLSRFIPPALR